MGGFASKTPGLNSQYHFSFGEFCSPSFFLEKNLINYNYSIETNDLINNLDSNRLIDIASIIISRPDMLTKNEIDFLLEKLIENYDSDQDSIDADLFDKKIINKADISTIDEYCKNFFSISSYRKKEFFNKKQSNSINVQYFDHPLDFLKINNFLRSFLNDSINALAFQEITETINILKSMLPIQATIAPNSNFFFPKDVDCFIFDFNDKLLSQKLVNNLGPYALSSNGQFVFLLSSLHLLFVFPILNNGALMPPKMIRLPFQEIDNESIILTTESCVTTFPGFIEIHPYPNCIKKVRIDIDEIASQNDHYSTNDNQMKQFYEMSLETQNMQLIDLAEKSDEYMCKITNGIIFVNIKKTKEQIGFICDVYDIKTGDLLNSIKLHKNNQQENNNCSLFQQWDFDPLLPEMFPDMDYCSIPIETNGTTISFIFEVQKEIAIYRTFSLLTGEFLSDERIYLNFDENKMEMTDDSLNHIIATSIDSLNNCRWILTANLENKVYLRKMQYLSSVDPNIFHIKDIQTSDQMTNFLKIFNNLLKYFCCSKNPPSFLICKKIDEFQTLLEILKNSIQINNNKLLIQTLCLLVSLNMINNEEFCNEKDSIFNIINNENIEIGLKFLLFVPNFSSLIKINQKETVDYLFNLFNEANSIDSKQNPNILLIFYTLKVLEKCNEFASFPLLQIKDIKKYIDLERFLPIFIVHQHVLIQNLTNFVEIENFNEDKNKKRRNALNIVSEYMTYFIALFVNELNNYKNKPNPEFQNKLIFKLFHNFLYLLVPLTKNHLVSQDGVNFLTPLLHDYIQFQDSNESFLKMGLLETCYLYSMFWSTLVSGGRLNPFEKKFIWAIKSNLDLLKNTELMQNLCTEIKGIEFLENDNYTLNYLYSNIKSSMNRKLPEEIQKIDKLSLLAISQHMNCLNDLFYICNSANSTVDFQISPPLRSSFLQMIRIRNSFRRSFSSKNEEECKNIFIKCHMLLKLKSTNLFVIDCEERAKNLADFILSSYSPEYIKRVFMMQTDRNPKTLTGFALINNIFEDNKNRFLESVIGHVMNKFLTSFEGLNLIILMEGNTYLQRKDISSFFENIYPISKNRVEKTAKTRIVLYRFFQSIKVFPDILESFLSNILVSFDQHQNDPGFYSLVVLMIKLMNNLPTVPFQSHIQSLIESKMNTYKLSIIENMLEKINDDFVFTNDFIKLFFEDSLLKSPIDIKIVMRIRYLLINMIKDDSLDDYIKNYLHFISNHLTDTDRYYSFVVTELITLLRKIFLLILQDKSSPFWNHSIYLQLMNSISNKDNYNESIALSLCAIFGFQMETISPFSVIKVCQNEDLNNLYLLIQSNNNDFSPKSCICYSLPFDISNEPKKYESIKEGSFITVVSEIKYNNVVFADKFKSMLITSEMLLKRFKIFPVCAQTLLNFYTINPEIITLSDQHLIDFMCSKITHFDDIYQTFNRIRSLQSLLNGSNEKSNLQILPENSLEFGEIQDRSTVTLLSFPIRKNAPSFLVNIEFIDKNNIVLDSKDDLFHFGIISDSLEEEELRLSTIGFPTGINLPQNKIVCDLGKIKSQPNSSNSKENSFNLSFIVNISKRKFTINSIEVDFPIGRQFRLIIFTKKSNNLEFRPTFAIENQMNASQIIFDFDAPPDLDKIISTKREPVELGFEDFDFLEFPEFIKNMKIEPNRVLKEDYHQYPKIDKFSHEMDLNEKLKFMPFIPTMNAVLHLYKSLGASRNIIEHHLSGLYLKLGRQWITVLLMKIAIKDPSLLSRYSFELFSTFSIPLESFNKEEFDQNRFPFSLEIPPWKSSITSSMLEENKNPNFYFLATNDMINALSSIIKNPICMNQIAQGLLTMSSSNNLHQIALPQKYHTFMCSNTNKIRLNKQSIVSFNNYEGIHKNAAFIFDENDNHKKVFYDFPLIFKKTNDSALLVTELNINNDKDCQISILDVNTNNFSMKNSWVIDTPIELLIHLKNFALAAKTEEHHALIKTILLDLYLGKSPFAIPFIDQFQDFVQMKCSASLFYKDKLYIKHLTALGGYLNSMEKPDDQYVFLYENEQRLMSSKFTINDAAHFIEFLPELKGTEIKSDSILIPFESLNPGQIKESYQSRILKIKLFFQKRESIVGFQFWDILPLWNQIVECFGFDNENENHDYNQNNNDENDPIFNPTITIIENQNVKVSNPTSKVFNVFLRFRRRMTTDELRSTIFQYSLTRNFDNPIFVDFNNFDKPIKIGKGDTFFSIVLDDINPRPWENIVKLEIEPAKNKNGYRPNPEGNKDHEVKITKEYKNEFINSIKSFLFDWKQEHTETLLNMFTIEQLKSPSFETISQIALESDLSKIFPKSVLLLRTLLIHQFSFIRYNHKDSVSEFLWNSCSNLVPILEKCNILRSAIKTSDDITMLTINRRKAILLVKNYKNMNDSINNNKRSEELCYIEKRKRSIIAQFTKKTIGQPMVLMRALKPFSIRFKHEDAIDAGGPTKELLNDLSTSIFEPSSQLFMKARCDEEYFIPETRKRNQLEDKNEILDEYFSVGVIIGIICRSGYPQNFPLAPFIWKYIAGELITPDDIAEIDRDFKNEVKNIRTKQTTIDWKATTWISAEPILLRSSGNKDENETINDDDDDEIEKYLNEYTKYRVNLLNPMLNKIREGFIANTELNSHPMLCGKVVSFLVQGSGDITTSQLQSITVVTSYNADFKKQVNIFWEVVDELTVEQRRLLLKFITGVTRIPKTSINDKDDFKIKIQAMNKQEALLHPDNQLPTAATCFNILYLPLYTNKEAAKSKILYAIQNCLTMENS